MSENSGQKKSEEEGGKWETENRKWGGEISGKKKKKKKTGEPTFKQVSYAGKGGYEERTWGVRGNWSQFHGGLY